MSGEWDVAVAESAKLALAYMNHLKEAKQDRKEGRFEIAEQKEILLKQASDAWDRDDLSVCADFLAGVRLLSEARVSGNG